MVPSWAASPAPGSAVVVSTWNASSDGSVRSNEAARRRHADALRTVATGADAIVSESVDGGHIAVLSLPTMSPTPEGCRFRASLERPRLLHDWAPCLQTIALPAADPSTIGYQVAIRGSRLVVLTYGLHEPSGPAWVTLGVYDLDDRRRCCTRGPLRSRCTPGWSTSPSTGTLPPSKGRSGSTSSISTPGRTSRSLGLAALGVPRALGPRGLVYAVNADKYGAARLRADGEAARARGLEGSPDFELRVDAGDDLVRELRRAEVTAEVGGARARGDCFEARLADRAAYL